MDIDVVINQSVFEYIDEKYKYEPKLDIIKNTKIKDILVSYNTSSRRFDIYNKGQRLELYKDEFRKFADINDVENINIHINHIITEYYKYYVFTSGRTIPFELQQTIINTDLLTKTKSHDNIIKNLVSRMEIQEKKTKDNIQQYILVKLQNQERIINKLELKLQFQERIYYIIAGFMMLIKILCFKF